jgi:ABC-type multidrug transport system ATPase subunit
MTIQPGELVAIIGASGAGKTTLLETMAGIRTPDQGDIEREGRIGYVPQDDVVHRELPLRRTLEYEARLRLPAGATRQEREQATARVLADLDLARVQHRRIGALSGGERKRAAIGVELLTRPEVFFLDEPTSGLDPVAAAEIMRLLEGLAGAGTTVVVATHNPPDVTYCDKVAVLAPTGDLAYFGTPEEARKHFGAETIDQIYGALTTTKEWRISGPDETRQAGKKIGPGRQWVLLTHRTAEIMRGGRLTVAILAGSPVMVLAMFVILFKPGAFDYAHPSPGTTVMVLFWIAFGGFFFGLTYGLLQICTEAAVLRRERLAGLSATAYVMSKIAVLLPLLAAVDALMLAVLEALDRLPAKDTTTYAKAFVTLTLSSAAALALGLLISAAVTDPAQATLALPMLCFPQVLFVGAILPVPVMAAPGQWLSYAMSNRWAFEGLGHSLGVTGLWAHGRSQLGPPLLTSYGDTFSRGEGTDWVILAALTAIFLAAACLVVARRMPPLPPALGRMYRG